MRALFDRSAEHGALVQTIEAARRSLERVGPRKAQTAIHRLERAFDKASRTDFFPGEAKAQTAAALAVLKQRYREAFAGGEQRLRLFR